MSLNFFLGSLGVAIIVVVIYIVAVYKYWFDE